MVLTRTDDFTYADYIVSHASKASRITGMMFGAFSSIDALFLNKLFVPQVRPILEYSSPVWKLVGVGLEQDIERVQSHFTKRLRGLYSMPFQNRLVKLQLDSLKDKRKRIDLIVAYTALHSAIDINPRTIIGCRNTQQRYKPNSKPSY